MEVYYHHTECHTEKQMRYLQGQGHSKGIYNKNITVSTISSKLLVRLQALAVSEAGGVL